MTYYVAGIPYSSELYHHGILGQKWGKQNGPPYPLDAEDHSKAEQKAGWRKSLDGGSGLNDKKKNNNGKETVSSKSNASGKTGDEKKSKGLTDRQKRIIKNVVLATGAVALTTAYVYYTKKGNFLYEYSLNDMFKKKVADIGLENLNDKDLIFDKGFEFHRISSRAVEDYSNAEKIYASFDPEDVRRYKAILPDFFKAWRKGGMDIDPSKVYDIALKANTEIKSPSAKKRVEAFIDMFNDSSFRSKMFKSLGMDYNDRQITAYVNGLGGNKKAALSLYEQFALALNGQGEMSEAPKMYFDKIRSMGYNALVDDNDAAKLSQMPMILLNPKDDFVVQGGRQVKKLERFMAVMKVKSADYRKAWR